jgi:transmembrane 9 superfamily protein 2/4
MSKELTKARKNGASKAELKKLKSEMMDKLMTARAGGVSFSTIKDATERGANLNDIKAKINDKNLKKFKRKGFLKKKETNLSSILFPGVAPEEFRVGTSMDIVVDTVDSKQTGIPILYYDLPVCEPKTTKISNRKRKNIGERFAGKAVSQLSPYKIQVLKNVGCTLVCDDVSYFRARDVRRMRKLIERQYKVNFSLDGLPIQVKKNSSGTVSRGFPLGARLIDESRDVTEYVYHNHVRFNIMYNAEEASTGHVRVVGFSATPISIAHDPKKPSETCNEKPVFNRKETLLPLNILKKHGGKELPVVYSYEVFWQKSDLKWTDRWDIYLLGRVDDTSSHHMSLINSTMVVLFLGSLVAIILVRSLRRDLSVYNEINLDIEDESEESGWKLVHGDVFRPPSTYPMALSVMVGTGCQIATAILLTLIMSQTHLINPMMKGRALSNIVVTFVCSGTAAGYISARIFKFSGGKNWKLNTIYTAACFPGAIMSLFLALNVFLTIYGSAKSVRVFTILTAFFLWLCIASPLVFAGSFIGFKRDPIAVPTRTNQIARVVPQQNKFLRSPFSSILVGAMPFSTICIEMYYLMGAIWLHQYYFLMGYLLVITILVGITCSLLSIVMCYTRLCSEDHRWWWKSFLDSATCGFWFFVYSIWFVTFRLDFKGIMPLVVYFTYMTMMSVAVSLYCGAVSFISTLWFTKTIYNSVKLD